MKRGKCDVLVIGGGVVGLSAAYYASQAGASVTVVEKGEIGSGSSSGNAGLVVPSFFEPLPGPGVIGEGLRHLSDPEGFFGIRPRLDTRFVLWLLRFARFCSRRDFERGVELLLQLNEEGLKAHLELAGLGGREYGFSQRGVVYVFLSQERLERAKEKGARAVQAGIACHTLGPLEVQKLEPLVSEQVVGGVKYETDAGLHPNSFLQWLARQAQSRGTMIMTQTEVYDFRVAQKRVRAVLTTRGEYQAEQVVLAAGAWSRPIGERLGVWLPVEGGKGLSLTFSMTEKKVRQPLILDEHVVVSPFSDAFRITGVLELTGLDLTLNPARVRGVQRTARRYLPMVGTMQPKEIWRGLRSCVPDGLPLLGRIRPLANVIVAGGHDTRGVSLGPVTGQYVSRLLQGESIGPLEKRLSPNRF